MWTVCLAFSAVMLAVFAVLYLKAGLKAVRVERGLSLFVFCLSPVRQVRHMRRIFTSFRNACIEEGRNPWLAWLAGVSLISAMVGAIAALVQLLLRFGLLGG